FVLAKEGHKYSRFYWQVYVGRRRSWALGVARESVTRKGPLTLSPENGFWAIGLEDKQDYLAYTDPLTHLSVRGKLKLIGIFLDIRVRKVTFYDIDNGAALHTFSIADDSGQEEKFFPFFSIGPATAEPDPEPLIIV
ncbi:RFPLA protein, partial [Serilophus lunatus]|nr:RFPLA protein [Serilophus lunatus]